MRKEMKYGHVAAHDAQATKDRLIEARERLMGTHVYFGGFAARVQWLVSRKVPTAATNGKKIWFNPDFVAKLSNRNLYGLAVHEVGHPALGHDLRRKGRDPKVWNIAADIVLNLLLIEEGISIPDGGIVQPQYRGKNAEDVYADLMQNGHGGLDADDLRDNPVLDPRKKGEKRKKKKSDPKPDSSSEEEVEDGTPGDESEDGEESEGEAEGEGQGEGDGEDEGEGYSDGGIDAPPIHDGEEMETGAGDGDDDEDVDGDVSDLDSLDDEERLSDGEQQVGEEASSLDPETEWRILSENLSAMAKRAGQMKGDAEGIIAEARKSKLNWAEHLAALIENADSTDDWNWKHPSRRYDGSSMLFPGDFAEEVKDIAIHVDTSGSMWDQKLMDHMAGEINGILKARSFQRAVIIYVDHAVQHVDEIDPRYEDIEFKPYGGGGTDFAPSFVWLAERPEYEPACHVYLTDMFGSFGSAELVPQCPVFWVNYGYSDSEVDPVWESVSTVVHVDRHEIF